MSTVAEAMLPDRSKVAPLKTVTGVLASAPLTLNVPDRTKVADV